MSGSIDEAMENLALWDQNSALRKHAEYVAGDAALSSYILSKGISIDIEGDGFLLDITTWDYVPSGTKIILGIPYGTVSVDPVSGWIGTSVNVVKTTSGWRVSSGSDWSW